MLDQNTTTVLTTLITVFGTLGGVILGVVLSNRYVARQEKAKRNTMVIEEIYGLLFKITNVITSIIDKRDTNRNLFNEVKEHLDRAYVLLNLYVPSLKNQTQEYFQSLVELSNVFTNFCDNMEIDPDDKISIREELVKVEELRQEHSEKTLNLQYALEKLVRKL